MSRTATWMLAGVVVGCATAYALTGPALAGTAIMVLPSLVASFILAKMRAVKAARTWPVATGTVLASRIAVDRQHQAQDATSVTNRARIEYEFTVGPHTYRGSRIHIEGDDTDPVKVQMALTHYPRGATVAVYYNPADPSEAVLDREVPTSPVWWYTIAVGIVLAGLAGAAAVTDLDSTMALLSAHLPAGAQPQFVFFFALAALLWGGISYSNVIEARRAASWPTTEGRVVASRVESIRMGAARRSTEVFQPVVEYAYRVGGQEYHNTTITLGAVVRGERESAAQEAAKFPPDSRVTVHYDPAAPARAVLEPRVNVPWFTGVVFVAFVLLTLFFAGLLRFRPGA